jgi:ribosome recycling factor
VEALKVDLSKVRAGRAHTGLLDHIKVDYYGSMMPISHANVTLADAHTIVQPGKDGSSRREVEADNTIRRLRAM